MQYFCLCQHFFVILQRKIVNIMNKRTYLLLSLVVLGTTMLMAQSDEKVPDGLAIATIVGEAKTADSPQVNDSVPASAEIPVWKQKLYYGYNFDIYYHHDSRPNRKENGWSIAVTPEIGWRLKERVYLGLRFGGSYQDMWSTYSYEGLDGKMVEEELRIQQGSWEVAPYARYRLKTLFNDKVGIWLEAHLYTGMEFPRVTDGVAYGTDYDGLKYNIVYGAQISPVITFKFNKKSTFQMFFSILSIGYSGTTFCYKDPVTFERYNQYTNDVIIFSGKLRNLIANQFTPGLYGLKFGILKNF